MFLISDRLDSNPSNHTRLATVSIPHDIEPTILPWIDKHCSSFKTWETYRLTCQPNTDAHLRRQDKKTSISVAPWPPR
nr:15864_t:CDS:2 [Entrophospora candida]